MAKKLSLAEEAEMLDTEDAEIDFDDKESIRDACKAGRIDPAVFEDKYPDETL